MPIDHGRPNDATIDLALIRRPATGDVIGSILVNPGGPGSSGVDFVRGGFNLGPEVGERFHLVGLDPRGVGASAPVNCAERRSDGPLPDHDPDSPAETAALDERARRTADACAIGDDGGLLPHLHSDAVADDLDLVRAALGDERLNYYGFSYGTRYGLRHAMRHPDRVGRMVLDGVVDDGDLPALLAMQADGFDAAFADFDAACAGLANCPPGGLAATYDELAAELDARPVGEVGPAELAFATLRTLYDEAFRTSYLTALSAAIDGDLAGIETLSDNFVGGFSYTSYVAVSCTDSDRPSGVDGWDSLAAELAARSPRFGATLANELRVCAHWPIGPSPSDETGGPDSDSDSDSAALAGVPLLLLTTTDDPATPAAGAQAVAERLPDAALVVADAQRHTAYGTGACVRDVVTAYLLTGTAPAVPVTC
ncbi:MAG: alpha/beta hydrolase [Actinomycetota bacterium]